MKYVSTRGLAAGRSFCDILLEGLAADGGLYLPQHYPQVSDEELTEWRGLSYADLAFAVLSKFIDDIPADDLRTLCRNAYSAQVFCHARTGDDAGLITPLHWLKPGKLALQGLSNGPTLAFKDMAMQMLGQLFEYVLTKRGATLNILGATSGDTGSSAEYAMRGKRGVKVFMLSPEGKMSAFQRAQMYCLQDDNIFNIAVTGMFDDAQDVVKAVSADAGFKEQYRIGAVNSINWARVAAQVVYYFRGYLLATHSNSEQVSFAVPSGNFGNICAGHIARQMGLPIKHLILATNENDVLDEFFRTGIYRPRRTAETHVTSSPSMDISKASNFERFVSDLCGRDSDVVKALWRKVDSGGAFDLNGTCYLPGLQRFGFVSGKSTHAQRVAAIRQVWQDHGIMIDPHTADAWNVAQCYDQDDIPVLVLETAQPVKFSETIKEALGREPERPAAMAGLESLPQKVEVMAPDAEKIKAYIRAHA